MSGKKNGLANLTKKASGVFGVALAALTGIQANTSNDNALADNPDATIIQNEVLFLLIKGVIKFSICLMFGLLIFSCSSSDEHKGDKYTNLDTSKFVIDTCIKNVNIDGKAFTIYFTRHKYDEHHHLIPAEELWYENLTITIVDEKSNLIACLITKKENLFEIFKIGTRKLNEKGKLLLELSKSAGGSGSEGKLYVIALSNEDILFTKILTYDELGCIAFKDDESIMYLLQGNWASDMSESHFDDHKFTIFKYSLNVSDDYLNGSYMKDSLGQTRYKYSGNAIEILKEISHREPYLIKTLDFSNLSQR